MKPAGQEDSGNEDGVIVEIDRGRGKRNEATRKHSHRGKEHHSTRYKQGFQSSLAAKIHGILRSEMS